MPKKFKFEKTVYLADTNAFGNVYFARYFEWQGMAREAFFKEVSGSYAEMLAEGVKYITISATINYKKESLLFDEVSITVEPRRVSLTTVELLFTYVNTSRNDVIAVGRQKIGFSTTSGEVIPIPKKLLEGAVKYLDENELKNLKKVMAKILSR